MDLLKASFKEVSTAVKTKKISASEIVQFFLNRIDTLNPKLNAYIRAIGTYQDKKDKENE